ncbi:malate synthase A [Bacillus methanolicus]|uniref:Malate synthase n=1 Tax=Bacillus methanolicus (strain MGA3 / ATCC 53907) TaxID=796606 RepID=I3E3N6_BACMM|nr:malate synthase A [Bacillus methanolicus]AIE58820.1 Malate synthase [Bacillus methanolicus MGA3]EIJ81107.1 malate synthase [Bacillus methanolicus MGA3]
MSTQTTGIEIVGSIKPGYEEILTAEALNFIEELERKFGPRRKELLQLRQKRQEEINQGKLPDFLPETEHIRNGDWTISPLPDDLRDRRVEITGPTDRKMIINALNSGAKIFMADCEDATSPTWENIVEGQINLRDAVNRTISFENPNGKKYVLNEKTAVLLVRPRGLHLEEKHLLLDGKPISGSFFDFGMYFFHNAKNLIARGTGPYFYLPKLESHLEARLWNDVFVYSQEKLGIPQGTIKATVLIETILAAFEMHEILYELREHSAGLNCGRWDYIFSYLKKFRNHENVILPDRSQVTMTVPFMRSYSLLTIQTCHRRKAPAIGGMAAQIPVKNNPKANEEAFAKVRADKEREARDGHDGTWVAHPALVPVALEVFNREMPDANQIETKKLEELNVSASDLLEVPEGTITENGVRMNINVGIQYVASWLSGRGAAPIHNLMEDAATAEISRAQLWQWIRHPKGILDDGRKVTVEMYEQFKKEELEKIKQEIGAEAYANGRFEEAVELFDKLILNDEFAEFLTLPGYEIL